MAWSAVGSPIYFLAVTSFSLTPGNQGDLILMSITTRSTSVFCTSLSSSNVYWSQFAPVFTATNQAWTTVYFAGKVLSTATATVTINLNGANPGGTLVDGQEFHSTVGSWSLNNYATLDIAVGNPQLTFPAISPTGPGTLYFAYGIFPNTGAISGGTPGYIYFPDPDTNGFCYNVNCNVGTQAPVWGGTAAANGADMVLAVVVAETAITRDQVSNVVANSGGTNTSIVITWPVNPGYGATVLAAVYNGTGIPTSVVDNGITQSTFIRDVGNNTQTNNVWIYRANGITQPASGGYTITVNVTAAQNLTAYAISYFGVNPGPPSSTNNNSNTGNGPVSTGSAISLHNGALNFATFSDNLATGTDTIALTNKTFVEQLTETNATLNICGAMADWINPVGPVAENCTWTINSSVASWAAAIAIYDAAPVPPPDILPSSIANRPVIIASNAGWRNAGHSR